MMEDCEDMIHRDKNKNETETSQETMDVQHHISESLFPKNGIFMEFQEIPPWELELCFQNETQNFGKCVNSWVISSDSYNKPNVKYKDKSTKAALPWLFTK